MVCTEIATVPGTDWLGGASIYATDFVFDGGSERVQEVIRRHKQRWRVENAYAEKKTKLMARTGSRDHGVRVFLFWLSTLLYNGWMLTRKFLRDDFPNHRPKDRGAVELTTFIKKILRLDYG